MYDIIKNVILNASYSLTDMMKKIDTVWIQGDITDDQKDELKALATEHAAPEASDKELLERALTRIASLEERITKLENGGTLPDTPEEEYPEWQPWDGINILYNKGSKCQHNEKKYISLVDNNTWEPGITGTETVWKVVE